MVLLQCQHPEQISLQRKKIVQELKQLDRDIKGKGLPGATKVTGSYVEKDDDTGKETKVKERSHVVTSGKKGKRTFKKAVKSLGKKYGQDCRIDTNEKNWYTISNHVKVV